MGLTDQMHVRVAASQLYSWQNYNEMAKYFQDIPEPTINRFQCCAEFSPAKVPFEPTN